MFKQFYTILASRTRQTQCETGEGLDHDLIPFIFIDGDRPGAELRVLPFAMRPKNHFVRAYHLVAPLGLARRQEPRSESPPEEYLPIQQLAKWREYYLAQTQI